MSEILSAEFWAIENYNMYECQVISFEMMNNYAKYYHAQQLILHGVVGQSEQLVCQCGEKPKDVPDDGYSYNCNKCRKPFAN